MMKYKLFAATPALVFAALTPATAQYLYVSSWNGVGTTAGTVSVIASAGSGATTLYSGLSEPTGLAFDGSGNLYVGVYGNGTLGGGTGGLGAIYEYGSGGTKTTYGSGMDYTMGLTFNAGNLFAASGGGNDNVYQFTAPLTSSVYYSGHNAGQLVFNGSGVLYVANYSNGSISEIPSGGGSGTDYGNGYAGTAIGLAFDKSGNLYESDYNSGKIYEYADGVISSGNQITVASGLNKPMGLTFDQNGDLFVANYGSGTIDEFTESGGVLSSSPTVYASGLNEPTFITFAPTPEPSTLALLGIGMGVGSFFGWHRHKRNRERAISTIA